MVKTHLTRTICDLTFETSYIHNVDIQLAWHNSHMESLIVVLIRWWCEEKMAMERTHCARRTCKYLWCVCVVMQTCHIITLHMHLYQTHIFGVYIYIYIYILRAYWNVGWLEGLVVWRKDSDAEHILCMARMRSYVIRKIFMMTRVLFFVCCGEVLGVCAHIIITMLLCLTQHARKSEKISLCNGAFALD